MRKRIAVGLLLTLGALYERPGRSQTAPTVRIGLTQNASTVSVRSTQPFTIQQIQTRSAKFTMVIAVERSVTGRVLTRNDLQYRPVIEIDRGRFVLVPKNEKIRIDSVGNAGIEARGLRHLLERRVSGLLGAGIRTAAIIPGRY